MAEKQLFISDPEFVYADTPDGVKLRETAYIVARYVTVEDGKVISRDMKHRFAISLVDPDFSDMLSDAPGTGPKCTQESCDIVSEKLASAKSKYSVLTPTI